MARGDYDVLQGAFSRSTSHLGSRDAVWDRVVMSKSVFTEFSIDIVSSTSG